MKPSETMQIDKTKWERGPWDREPDKVDFEYQGYSCRVLRHRTLGHLCGYVGVTGGHPAYKVTYLDLHEQNLGWDFLRGTELTFSDELPESNLWWFGFDCAHSNDRTPFYTSRQATYKGVDWVMARIYELADALKQMEPGNETE